LPWPLRDSLSKTSIAESKYTQLVAKSQSITLTFWIDIDENAAVGDYTAYLILYRKMENGLRLKRKASILFLHILKNSQSNLPSSHFTLDIQI
jgi:hypothetical protein